MARGDVDRVLRHLIPYTFAYPRIASFIDEFGITGPTAAQTEEPFASGSSSQTSAIWECISHLAPQLPNVRQLWFFQAGFCGMNRFEWESLRSWSQVTTLNLQAVTVEDVTQLMRLLGMFERLLELTVCRIHYRGENPDEFLARSETVTPLSFPQLRYLVWWEAYLFLPFIACLPSLRRLA